jgi:tRNA G18 (ribose-2'-O)-methylase SpoU
LGFVLDVHTQYEAAEVADFQSLKGKGGHLDRGLFIAENPKVIDRVLTSSMRIHAAYLTEDFLERYRAPLEARDEKIQAYVATQSAMESVIGYPLHQGVMMTVEIPESPDLFSIDIPPQWSAVALDSIADAENMGAIVRNCAAFGVTSIIIDDRCCDPYLRRSVRVSMGTIADVTIYRVPHLAPALEKLSATGVTVIGAALGESSRPLGESVRHDRTVLVFGSEGWGIRESVRRECSELRSIPMSNGVDSLNVAIASGIFLYEYMRRG